MSAVKTVPSLGQDLAKRWYVPLEVETLRLVQPAVVLINALALGLAVLRDNGDARPVATLLLFTHGVTWILLRELVAGRRGLRDGLLLSAGATLTLSVWAHMIGPDLWVDRWFSLWSIAPAGLVMWNLSTPVVAHWCTGRLSTAGAEQGLARNRKLRGGTETALRHVALVHACALVVLPLLWILDVALSPGNALGGGFLDAVTGEHFQKMLASESFWLWTRNSVIVSVGTTLLGLALAIPAGYAFSRFKFRGRDPAMFAFLLVQMFPGVIILVPYFLVMKALGLLNTSFGLILAYSVTALPLCVWMLKGFFDTVPRELEEAALMDGCSQTQVFWKIVLPLSLPAVAVTALFSFLAAWNEFLLALTFNTSESMYTLPVGLASLISSTGQAWGDFAAASLLVSLPVVVLFIVFQRFLIEGLSAGGVKG